MPLPIARLLDASLPSVAVEVLDARGSTPREIGAWMLVTDEATAGTIGGGQLEFIAIERARTMLAGGGTDQVLSIPLGPEIGQCCGGFVRLGLRHVDRDLAAALHERLARDAEQRPHVYLFGAGHVGLALAEYLSLLPVRPVLVDSRPEALAEAADGVETRLLAMPDAILAEVPPGSAVAVMTHDHALDFLITAEALKAERFSYVGMIGSKTKRSSFRRSFPSLGGTAAQLAALVCPVGGAQVRDKRPAVIAALVAAEIATHLFATGNAEKGAGARATSARDLRTASETVG